MKTGIIGLGAMGAPMARNLHAAGHLAAVWNRTPDKAQALHAELGVPAADSPQALAADCELIILSVSADEDVLAMIDALMPGLQAGSVVLDTSTVSRATARQASDTLASIDVAFLDAPVSGGIEGARQGTLAMMIGGEAAVLERVRPVLDSIAGRVAHMGPVGSGQATKAVNQVMAAGINQAVSEALAFADALQLPLAEVIDVVGSGAAGINQAVSEALAFADALQLPLAEVIDVVGSGAAGNWFLTHRGPTMTQQTFEPGFRVALHHKDLAICRQMAAELDVAMPLVEMTLIHYRRLMEAGYGDEDISALYREKLRLFDKG